MATAPASLLRPDYDFWGEHHNDALPDGERPVVQGATIIWQLGETWPEVLLGAQPTIDTADPRWESVLRGHRRDRRQAVPPPARWRRDALRLLDLPPEALIARGDIGRMLNRNPLRIAARADFPRPVARLHNHALWRHDTIRAYLLGEAIPPYSEGEAQAKLVTLREVAHRLDIQPETLRTQISRQRWTQVPPPAGRAAGHHYCWRADPRTGLPPGRARRRRVPRKRADRA